MAFVHIIIVSFNSHDAVAWRDVTDSAADGDSGHAQRALPWGGTPFVVAHHLFEHLPEAGGHQVVEDGVYGRAQVEKDPGDDVDVLVDLEDLDVLTVLLVHEAPHQAVGVKRGPADAEHHHQNN